MQVVMREERKAPNPPTAGIRKFGETFGDPCWIAPVFFLLLVYYAWAYYPRLTFSLGEVLGFTLDYSQFSWVEIGLVMVLRFYLAYLLVRAVKTAVPLVAGLTTATLLCLSYFPLAWGWLGWVALVPLLSQVRGRGPAWRIYLAAWYAGLAFFWPVLEWMGVADFRMYGAWALLATYCSAYFPLAIWLIRRLDRATPLPFIVTVPMVWAGLEFVRSFMLTGFAWYFLGHTQHSFLPLIQMADLTGVYGISFLVAASNAWVFEFLYAFPAVRSFCRLSEPSLVAETSATEPSWKQVFRPGKWLGAQGLTVFGLGAAALFYGYWRLDQNDFRPGPRLALLQGSFDQRFRNFAATREGKPFREEIMNHYKALSDISFRQSAPPDLIVWPETSFPYDWFDVDIKLKPENFPRSWPHTTPEVEVKDVLIIFHKYIQELAARYKTDILLGANSYILNEEAKEVRFNSALLVGPDGYPRKRYDKIHRLPFGEYVPFRETLSFLNKLAPYDFDYSIKAGENLTRFTVGKYTFGVIICYEDTDPFLARGYLRKDADGPPADFLINISNDGWFDGTSEHEEHLAICRFRAIECRRAVARSVNMGISAVIDGNGRVLAPTRVTEFYSNEMMLRKYHFSRPLNIKSWELTDSQDQARELLPSHWSDYKKVSGVMGAVVPIDDRFSLYAYLGDWFPLCCWAGVVAGLFLGWYAKKRMPVPKPLPAA